ncbi:MAG: FadR/GntR family transcriptional regulator [Alphaproteobacteria bacterium]
MEADHGGATGRETLSDKVAARILRQIVSGELAPGARLPAERRLSEELGVSRVSVRAGLQKLKAQGLLQSVQGGGTSVAAPMIGNGDPALLALAKVDRASLVDLVDLRSALEVWAARRAAQKADAHDIAAIYNEIEKMRDGRENKAKADFDFHLSVARASGSPIYRHLLGIIRSTVLEMLTYNRFELFGKAEHDAAILMQHEAVAEAIAVHDPDAAEAAMRAHLNWVRQHYINAGLAD